MRPSNNAHYYRSEGESDDDDEDQRRRRHDEDEDDVDEEASRSPGGGSPAARDSLPTGQQWPQSYRQSMDMYSYMASPSLSMFSPSVTRHSGTFLTTSNRRSSAYSPDAPESNLKDPFLPRPQKPERAEQKIYHTAVQKRASEQKPVETYDDKPSSEAKCSFTQALLNGMNVLAGVGVLTTPYALKEAGWISLVLLFGLALICLYTGMMLRWCLDSKPGLATYPDIGQAAFGDMGRLVISVILYSELYACCVEFLILEGDNLSALFPGAHFHLAGVHVDSHKLFVLLTALCILPTVWLRNLSLLSYVSAGGVIASVIVVCSVFWVGTVDNVGFSHSGPLLNIGGVPLAIGLYGFCFSGHAVFPNIYSSMRNPAQFNRVLQVSFLICTCIFGGVAIMGFTMFGQDTASQITLNLPNQLVASKVALWTTVVNPFTKYALTITPVALSLEELLPPTLNAFKYRSTSILIRTLLVASTIAVAILVPFFGYVMAFIGSFLSVTVSVILPSACYLSILGKRATMSQALLCTSIIGIGLVCLIAGTFASVAGIAESIRSPDA